MAMRVLTLIALSGGLLIGEAQAAPQAELKAPAVQPADTLSPKGDRAPSKGGADKGRRRPGRFSGKAVKPGVKGEKPGMKAEKPGIKGEKPAMKGEKPGKPGMKGEKPTMSKDAAAKRDLKPAKGKERPKTPGKKLKKTSL